MPGPSRGVGAHAGARIRVGLLFGGRSPEHEISITSAASIAREADPTRLEIVPVYIDRDGRWFRLRDLAALASLAGHVVAAREIRSLPARRVLLEAAAGASLVAAESAGAEVGADGAKEPVDLLFPALHGQGGEDGSIQGLARLADLPVVGSGVLGSALGMDKISTKRIASEIGIPVAPYVVFTRHDWARRREEIRRRILSALPLPLFVKPAETGSSVGISKVKTADDLESAVEDAARFGHRILAEMGIDGRELEVAVLGNDEPEASVVGEILPGREFYDYAAKYFDQSSRTVVPADIPGQVSDAIREHAIRIFLALDLAGMARVDFFLDRRDSSIYLNEVNTIPGFTPISMYPMLWQASGISYPDLLTRLVELALERHRQTRVELEPPGVG